LFLLGLTGGIGMGKSETARIFRRLGVPVHDADACVHALYAKGGRAVGPIGAAFAGTVADGAVDRTALAAEVVGKPDRMARLEAIVHPLVRAEEETFLERQASAEAPVVVLDIPLLYETGRESSLDAVAVVSAPPAVQRERVAGRPGMTPDKLAALLARQVPDVEKRARADFVIETGCGVDYALHQVRHVLALVSRREPKAWRAKKSGAVGAA
jgi:dephospho-CoA kinase